MSRRDACVFGLAFSLWFAAYSFVALTWPYQSGFDDFDHIPAAQLWSTAFRLPIDGLFLRVPLWPMLLGTFFRFFGIPVGLFLVQAGIVAGAMACYLLYTREPREALPPAVGYLPLLLFALSPQAVLYARHAVNEPFIGLLTILVMVLGGMRPAMPFRVGLVCGAGMMTKVVAAFLILPALCYLVAGRTARELRPLLVRFAIGIAVVAVPLVLLHLVQRGFVPIDTTAAYNLSEFSPDDWFELGDHQERYDIGMKHWRATISQDPAGYLARFGERLIWWLSRPSTTDFSFYYAGYPRGWIQACDHALLYGLAAVAIIGIRRRTAIIWLFLVAIAFWCTFPPHTPFSPKVILVYPLLLMAPEGLRQMADWFRRINPGRPDER